jgi:malonyl-CoA O-methyltransferase
MPDQIVDKGLVAKRFRRGAATYDRYAVVQQRMASVLADRIACEAPDRSFRRVLEPGCGTGTLTEVLFRTFQIDTWTGNDLVPECGSHLADRFKDWPDRLPDMRFVAGDMEAVPLPGDADLVASSAAFQWLAEPGAFLEKVVHATAPGGLIAFATFGEGNLRELASLTGLALRYPCWEALIAKTAPTCRVLHVESCVWTLRFATALDVLRHIRATGTNAISRRVWSADRTRALLRDYEGRFTDGSGVPLTYQPTFCLLRKDGP